MTHAKTVAVVWGSQPPAHSVGYCEPMWPGDSGLTVLFDDAPDPDEVQPDDPRITLVYLSCLIEDHPELGRAMEIARRFGVVDLDEDGGWIMGNVSRLSPN
jgi:hypothetical protein